MFCHLKSLEISKISMSTIQVNKVWSWVMSNSADVYGFEWCIQECSRPCFQPQNFCILGCYDFQYLRKYVSTKSSYFFNKALVFPLMFFNTNCNFDKLKIIGFIIGLIGSITKIIQ